jgi:hypothetical protein
MPAIMTCWATHFVWGRCSRLELGHPRGLAVPAACFRSGRLERGTSAVGGRPWRAHPRQAVARRLLGGSARTGLLEARPSGAFLASPSVMGSSEARSSGMGCFEAAPSRGENVELSAGAFAGLLPVACQPAAAQSCATDSF